MSIILWLVGLTFLNASFSIFEMSLAACRELRLEALHAQGNKNALKVIELRKKPTLFIGTAQLALNIIAILSGMFIESVLSEPLVNMLMSFQILDETIAHKVATFISILIITLTFLLFGDLIPKKIAIQHPESIACNIVSIFSKIVVLASPILKLLELITDNLVKKSVDDGVTFEEVCLVIEQGVKSGAVEKSSVHIVENALNLDERSITEIMIPRTEIDFIDSTLSSDAILSKMKTNPHHRFIVCKKTIDQVQGTIDITDLIPVFSKEKELNIESVIKQIHYIPETLNLQQTLFDLQNNQKTLAMIVNEFGEVTGMIRLTDIHNIITEKNSDIDSTDWITKRVDGSYLVAGETPVSYLKEYLGITEYINGEDLDKYHNINGMAMYLLHRMPKEGDIISLHNFDIEIVDIDKRIVDKVLITKKA